MQRAHLFVVSAPLLVLAACTKAPETETLTYPKMVLGQGTLDFGTTAAGDPVQRTVMLSNEGDMIMGVGSGDEGRTGIDIGIGMDGNFTVAYNVADIVCPDGAASDTAAAKSVQVDSGGGGGGGGGTGNGGESGGGGGGGGGGVDTGSGSGGDPAIVDDGTLFHLDPGCTIPLTVSFDPTTTGEIWSSLIVESIQAELTEEQDKAGDLPDFLRDPVHYKQMVYLHGAASQAQGTLVVSPRSFDFGFVYPGISTEPARIEIQNVGDADVTLTSIGLSDTCDPAYTLGMSPVSGSVLPAGQTTLIELNFAPDDTSASYCQVDLTSDDPANPEVAITIKGNSGTDPDNHGPTVAIRSPANGYVYGMVGDLVLEVNAFDRDQPAQTLTCKVKSAIQDSSIATCTPPDESGHVYVTIPADTLEEGVDTLTVTVTDGSQVTANASVSVLINAAFPDDDDDGDGYSATAEVPDCDDGNGFTYPDPAEIFDGADNDCDGVTDEGTQGYDDDGDDWSEADGDCNDDNADAYPGGPERGDSVDNDCNGIVDETTSLYDDDGDGFAEVNNDCDDNNADVSPSADELCDGIDNDCDGLKDTADGCVATDSEPIIIGGVKTSQNACEAGDVIAASVFVFDADGQATTYQWNSDTTEAQASFDNAAAQTANWTCPEPPSSGGKAYHVYVIAFDPDGHQVWADETVAVYPGGYGLYDDYTRVVPSEGGSGCAHAGNAASPGLAMALAALGALVSRRRR